MEANDKQWDVFISHATEDKDGLVRPLAAALQSFGVRVWYDEFSLSVGDSLSRSIDKGLAGSRYGLVVVSPHFIEKPWTEYELRGLVAREIEEDKVILPVWLGVTKKKVLEFSPPLADKMAIIADALDAGEIGIKILKAVRPDIYEKHPRAELEKIASGEAFVELKEELEATKEELQEFQCPICFAPLSERGEVQLDERGKIFDLLETFDCGYQSIGGTEERPCPSDPEFPQIEDYELHFSEVGGEDDIKWRCIPVGKTKKAKKLQLSTWLGKTKEKAKKKVLEQYARYSKKY